MFYGIVPIKMSAHALVAQGIEHQLAELGVAGSNPAGRTILENSDNFIALQAAFDSMALCKKKCVLFWFWSRL